MYLSHKKISPLGTSDRGSPRLLLLTPDQVGYRSLTPKRPVVGDLEQRTWGEGDTSVDVRASQLAAAYEDSPVVVSWRSLPKVLKK